MDYQDWINQIKPEKKKRNYQHLDDSLDLADPKIFKEVIRVVENIKEHQFLPFIKKDDTKIRFRKSKTGEVRRERKVRPIMYASHIDAHIYSYYNFVIGKKYENRLKESGVDDSVVAYRRIKVENGKSGKSNIHFAKEVFDHIKEQDGCVVITQDIEGFFDNLHHKILKEKICSVCGTERLDDSFYKVLRSLTAFRYIEHSDFVSKEIKKKVRANRYAIYQTLKGLVRENKTGKGIPQGSPISGLFANVYLVDFDHEIRTKFPDVFYRRYSDDLVFVCKEDRKNALLEFVDSLLKISMLSVNSKKSFVTYFNKKDGLSTCDRVTDGTGKELSRNYVDYLGFEFNGRAILLRKNTIQRLKRKQVRKAMAQLLNSKSPRRRRPRKNFSGGNKSKNNYFKRSIEVIQDEGLRAQILKTVRDRNKAGSNVPVGNSTSQTPNLS